MLGVVDGGRSGATGSVNGRGEVVGELARHCGSYVCACEQFMG